MTLNELQRHLDPKRIGMAPVPVKLGVLAVVLVLIVAASYWFDWQYQQESIAAEQAKEKDFKDKFIEKKKVALELPAYTKRLEDIKSQFGTLLKQLPGRSEMDALLTDINQAGLGRGLNFELFKPASQEIMRDFYAELPISIKISGSYHDIGAFASDIGKLSRIVTLNDISLTTAKDGLSMDAIAKTFRYLDEDEIAKQRKEAAAAKDKGKAKAAPTPAPGAKK